MTTWLFYVDEAYDRDRFCLSALAVSHRRWRDCFAQVKAHRVGLRGVHGIPIREEIHARDLVGGRGSLGIKAAGARPGKWQRSRIFFDVLQLIARMQVRLINVCLDARGQHDPHMAAWDRLVNRIERTMLEVEKIQRRSANQLVGAATAAGIGGQPLVQLQEFLNRNHPRAIIIADEGKEHEITRAIRRMHVFNPIPSQFGTWPTGQRARNIPADHLIEDPIFRDSARSHFLQLVDCVAFALLKREVPPTRNVKRYGIEKMFDATVAGVCYRQASPKDPLGIVRT